MIELCQSCGVNVFRSINNSCPVCRKPLEPMGTKIVAEPDLPETTELPPLGFDVPTTIAEIASQGGSEIGNSAVATWLSCPEHARLRALGVVRKVKPTPEGLIRPLEATEFGSVFHAISSVRTVYGHDVAKQYLEECLKPQLASEDYLLAFHLLATTDIAYPLARDAQQFEVLGVECTVRTAIRGFGGEKLIRTVRYDRVIRLLSDSLRGRGVYSLELKTDSNSGESALQKYTPQRCWQQAIWNANAALVGRYGPMHGVIFEQAAKTKIPKVERYGPYCASKHQEAMMLDYMRLPEAITYPVMPDGEHYPRMLHTCFGRYGWCPHASLCWEKAVGDYVWP